MNAREKANVLDERLPLLGKVTLDTIAETKRLNSRFRGSVRVSTGRVYTDDEFQARRKRVLNTKLPHMG